MRAHLDGFLQVHARVSDDAEQIVEASHLLHQNGVHALVVAGGEVQHDQLQVKVGRQLAEDVGGHLEHHVVRRLGVAARRAGLIRGREAESRGPDRKDPPPPARHFHMENGKFGKKASYVHVSLG